MNECRMVEFCPCKIIGIIISAILGIAAGALFFNGIITVIPFVLWFFIIFAAIALAFFVIASLAFCLNYCEDTVICFCRNLGLLLTGSIGTIVLGIFLLLFPIAVTLLVSFLIGLLVFFFGLLITGIICYLLCICDNICPDNQTGGASNNNNNNCCCCCYPCNCDTISQENTNSCKLKC